MGDPADPLIQRAPTASGNADPELKVDRRRPGRIEHTNRHLIALLRGAPPSDEAASVRPGADDAPVEPAGPERQQENASDDLAPARGIAFGVLLAAPFWAAVAALCWWWFRR
jgi:hypothetical protein